MTALMYASMYGELELAKLLIDRGANIEFKDEHGMNPLLAACMMGHANVGMSRISRSSASTACS